MSLNQVTLLGNVGRVDVKSFDWGKIANLSLATSETWKDKSTGERKSKTEWHSVVVKNQGLISVVERFVEKGSQLLLQGKLETRKWQDKDGTDRYSTEIVLGPINSQLVLLGAREHSEERESPRAAVKASAPPEDDDIPF